MAQQSFLSDILRRVAATTGLGRSRDDADKADLIAQCHSLLQDRGEALGLALAKRILDRIERLDAEEKHALFLRIAEEFGIDDDRLAAAIGRWTPGDVEAAREIHFASEPRAQLLIRALNRVPGATATLVGLRGALLDMVGDSAALKGLDRDFQHLFASWFNRGFLEIRRIDWSTPADILEKIIAYEAVHEITGWDDLRQRVGDPDRRLFAFFHPAMPAEPLIFVEVALTTKIPGAIAPILAGARAQIDPETATTAVFYSISNCQKGLRGISFGSFLIKQVVVELQHELPNLTTFVTLSPVPGLRRWVASALESNDPLLTEADRALLHALEPGATPPADVVARLAARYLVHAKRPGAGTAFDAVAHFHLGNGAILHKVHAEADLSPRGIANSWGAMVNYLYEDADIETHHQAYATERDVAASSEVRSLAKIR